MRRLSTNAFEMGVAARPWSGEPCLTPATDEVLPLEQQIDTYRQAYLEGFDAGYADGESEARKVLEALQQDARSALREADEARQCWREQLIALSRTFAQAELAQSKQMEALAVTIAYTAVCRILGAAHAEGELILKMCREALASLSVQPTALRIAPADKPAIESAGLSLELITDASLQAGDCILVTGLGEIEVGIDTQLTGLKNALLMALQKDAA